MLIERTLRLEGITVWLGAQPQWEAEAQGLRQTARLHVELVKLQEWVIVAFLAVAFAALRQDSAKSPRLA
jgi:hypothetical protein